MRTAFLMTLIAIVAGCGGPSEPSGAPRERVARVETTVPTVEALPVRVELAATVEPLHRIDVCARVAGVVGEFCPPNLDIGHRVAAGAPVVRLDVPELESQREQRAAALALAKSQTEQATEAERVAAREVTEAELVLKKHAADVKFRRLETKRVTDLAARGATQPERVEEVQRQLEVTEAAHESAQSTVETKKAKQAATRADIRTAEARVGVATADLKTTEEMIALATVKAPPGPEGRRDGAAPFYYTVTRRLVDRGATVKDAAQPLLTLMHVDTVRVLVDVSERDVPLLEALVRGGNAGAPSPDQVVLRVASLREGPSRGEFRGRITRTSGVLDPVTRTMRAEVEFDNRGGELRPGMYGTMTLTLGTRPGAIVLPSSAFVRRDGRSEVLVVDGPSGSPPRGVVRAVPVEIGLDDGKRVQVTSGLTGKERVIVRGNTPVSEGDAVISVEWRGR